MKKKLPLFLQILLTFCLFSGKLNAQNLHIHHLEIIGEKPISIKNPSNLSLRYGQNSLVFVLDSAAKKLYFRLVGFDKNWQEANNIQTIQYANLGGGEYVLELKNDANSLIINQLKFSIENPFWLKWWFVPAILLYIFFMAGSVFYLFYFYKIRKKIQMNALRSELENQALRSQMNPHFLFNVLNAIKNYILFGEYENAERYLGKFSKLMRLILNNSRNQFVSLKSEIELIELYVALEQRQKERFKFMVSVDGNIIENLCQIPSMVIQPFIENAIIHGLNPKPTPDGILTLKILLKNENLLQIEVQDNGIGRAEAQKMDAHLRSEHQSAGIEMTEERLRLLNQEKRPTIPPLQIEDIYENGVAAGTKVILFLPIG